MVFDLTLFVKNPNDNWSLIDAEFLAVKAFFSRKVVIYKKRLNVTKKNSFLQNLKKRKLLLYIAFKMLKMDDNIVTIIIC